MRFPLTVEYPFSKNIHSLKKNVALGKYYINLPNNLYPSYYLLLDLPPSINRLILSVITNILQHVQTIYSIYKCKKMKKIFIPLLLIVSFTACKKQATDEIDFNNAKNDSRKIDVCHREANGTFHTINISINAMAAHLAHGDFQGDCSVASTTICNQAWMVKNLDLTHYRNGDEIPQVSDPAAWASLTTGAWCYYNNDPLNGAIYGKLYNWYAVNDPRGLAPVGWHLPSDIEWALLRTCLGGYEIAGGRMKTTGNIESNTGLWHYPNTESSNISNFSALPGGARDESGLYFVNIGYEGLWWSSTVSIIGRAFYSNLVNNSGAFGRGNTLNQVGLSVRCLKD